MGSAGVWTAADPDSLRELVPVRVWRVCHTWSRGVDGRRRSSPPAVADRRITASLDWYLRRLPELARSWHHVDSMTDHLDRDVISQIRLALAHPLPLAVGALLGALVPVATYTVGHEELGAAGWASVPGAVVVGGCLFSARTVYGWTRRAFRGWSKALGFVLMAEGVMTFSQTPWLSLLMLGFLVAINAVATGSNLAVEYLDAVAARRAREAVAAVPAVAVAPAPVPQAAAPSALAPEAGLVPAAPAVPASEVAVARARRRAPRKSRAKTAPRAQDLN